MPRSKPAPVRSLPFVKPLFDVDGTQAGSSIWSMSTNNTPAAASAFTTLDGDSKKVLTHGSSDLAGSQNGDSTHPLAQHPGVPPLTDLQICITEAILLNGEPCHFDQIYEYVHKKWRSLKRRDGSSYTTDCRRALQANLRQNPNCLNLFLRDPEKDGLFTICRSVEGTTYSKQEGKENKIVEDKPKNGMKAEEEPSDDEPRMNKEDEEGDSEEFLKIPPGTAPLTELQALISQSIITRGGVCHFELIFESVSQHWNKLKGRDGLPKQTDCRRAILASLSKNINSQPLFQRDHAKPGHWCLGEYNPMKPMLDQVKGEDCDDSKPKISVTSPFGKSFSLKRESPSSTRSSPTQSPAPLSPADAPLPAGSAPVSPLQPSSPPSPSAPRREFGREAPLTELQVLIINAITANKGCATVDQIQEAIAKQWSTLKRRDGSKAATDPRRAILASLSSGPNTHTRPVFKRDPKDRTLWLLGKRALEFLKDHPLKQSPTPSPTASPSLTPSPLSRLNRPPSSKKRSFDGEEEEDSPIKRSATINGGSTASSPPSSPKLDLMEVMEPVEEADEEWAATNSNNNSNSSNPPAKVADGSKKRDQGYWDLYAPESPSSTTQSPRNTTSELSLQDPPSSPPASSAASSDVQTPPMAISRDFDQAITTQTW